MDIIDKRRAAKIDADLAAEAFAALGSAPRLAVLRSLVRAGGDGLTVGALQDRTGIAPSTLSHHLRALVAAGLIVQTRSGRSLICTARFDRVQGLADFLIIECCADIGGRHDASGD
ncbi:MAG: metalloregulator ArsR/SmtB family transcription factor [Pseudomonadota bacterium]